MVAGGRRRGMHSIRLMALDPDDRRKMIEHVDRRKLIQHVEYEVVIPAGPYLPSGRRRRLPLRVVNCAGHRPGLRAG